MEEEVNNTRDATADDAVTIYELCEAYAKEYQEPIQKFPPGTKWRVATGKRNVFAALAYFDGFPGCRWVFAVHGSKRGLVLLRRWIESDSSISGLQLFGGVNPRNLVMMKFMWKNWNPLGMVFTKVPN